MQLPDYYVFIRVVCASVGADARESVEASLTPAQKRKAKRLAKVFEDPTPTISIPVRK